jgi:ribosomal protein L37AE/L43A
VIADIRTISDLLKERPNVVSVCPVCRALRVPRIQTGLGVFVWSCSSQACVIRELRGEWEPVEMQPRQLELWQEAA